MPHNIEGSSTVVCINQSTNAFIDNSETLMRLIILYINDVTMNGSIYTVQLHATLVVKPIDESTGVQPISQPISI